MEYKDTKLHIILLISDMLGAALSIILAFAIRYHVFMGVNSSNDQLWVMWLIILAAAIANVIISPVNKYTCRGPFAELLDVIYRQFVTVLMVVTVLYLAHSSSLLSRLVFIYFVVISVIVIWLMRLLLKKYLLGIYKGGTSSIRLVVISSKQRLDGVVERINSHNDWEHVICKAIPIDEVGYDKALEYIVRNEVDEVFVSMPMVSDMTAFQEFLTEIVNMGVKVDIDIDQFELDIPGHKSLDDVGHYAVVSVSRNTISISRRFIKRAMDIIGGAVGTLIFLLVGIILVPVIKLDSKGPAIFVQKRVGKNGRIFNFYKFRSMCADAEARKKELMKQNEVSGLMFKMENDPRITKVGKFIRKTSLDELPQFWNVLKGDMSLVGTRPPTMDEYEKYEPWQKARLSMKPGITGLWQVSGRSDIQDFTEVVKLDMKYIDNWSFAEDVKILIKTVFVVFLKKGSK